MKTLRISGNLWRKGEEVGGKRQEGYGVGRPLGLPVICGGKEKRWEMRSRSDMGWGDPWNRERRRGRRRDAGGIWGGKTLRISSNLWKKGIEEGGERQEG